MQDIWLRNHDENKYGMGSAAKLALDISDEWRISIDRAVVKKALAIYHNVYAKKKTMLKKRPDLAD